jgi:flagellar biosynthesis protein FliP
MRLRALLTAVLVLLVAPCSQAQLVFGPPAPTPLETALRAAPGDPQAFDAINPVSILDAVAESTGLEGGLVGALNILVLLTILSLAPAIMVMTTCFVRIIIVLGLLKQAMGTQQLPPAQVTLGLALIMTFLVMTPTLERIWNEAINPYQQGEIVSQLDMWDAAKQPVRDFMFNQLEVTGNWSGLYMVMNFRGQDTSEPENLRRADVDTLALTMSYMLSELKVAFLMGFRVYLPFLVIDMVIASLLISMSMMMLPPVLISLPFKLLLFVLVDGWILIIGSLLESFAQTSTSAQILSAGG